MKPIKDNTRAACYLKSRQHMASRNGGGEGSAVVAWRYAASTVDNIAERQAAWDKARADLKALWEGMGRIEPKRFDADGEALSAARDTERRTLSNLAAVRAYAPSHSAPYAGMWQKTQGHYFCEKPDSYFRDVRLAHECANLDHKGYFDNPQGESGLDGWGLVVGVVAQLSGRDGRARFVAGYRMGSGDDGGATFDLATIYESDGEDPKDAQREAARVAGDMAESAADTERDYQTAWQAGQRWADLGQDVKETRASVRAALKERRAVAQAIQPSQVVNLCAAIRAQISAHLDNIRAAQETRNELAQGQVAPPWWSPNDAAQLDGFADGAGLDLETARAVCL